MLLHSSVILQSLQENYNVQLLELGFIKLIFLAVHAGSFSRSAVNHESGAKTGLSGIIMGTIIGSALLFMTPLFTDIPQVIFTMCCCFGGISLSNCWFPCWRFPSWNLLLHIVFLFAFYFLLTLSTVQTKSGPQYHYILRGLLSTTCRPHLEPKNIFSPDSCRN